MDRRNFMKCLGGTGLAMMCGDALGATLTSAKSEEEEDKEQDLFNGYLRFNKDGKIKIVQFTDVHYKWEDQRKSQPSLDNINLILDKEKPDFVIFTGDLVYSQGTFEGLDMVLEPVIKRNIHFAVVWGNHDDEFDHTRTELYDYVQQKKGALMPKRVIDKSPDYIVPIKEHNSDKVASLLYCIDSNAHSQIKSIGGYDWIHSDQIEWYRKVSKQFTLENEQKALPSLAFFHIAIPEFREALKEDKNRVFGVKAEGICSPKINSGFFAAVKECGDIMGIFIGHDHDNDYAVMYRDVMLAYGRYSGGDTVYNDIHNGARIIELYENERKMDTYIHLSNNEIDTRITYPDSFVLKRYNKVPLTEEEKAQEAAKAQAETK